MKTLISAAIERQIRIATGSEAHVLILGPTGSGKTTLARRIHEEGSRKGKPFVTVNLATLHEGTLESELFGHERGAFTGADQRRTGKLELAQGGTVFLDEIAELPLRLQARLLEFLQFRTVSPVGSTRELRLDVRIIAATHQNLQKRVAEGSFREDLLHRLRVVCFRVPSLAERAEDFGSIVHDCLESVCREHGRQVLALDEEVARGFEDYLWPGNLRELGNVLEYAVLACGDGRLAWKHLPDWFVHALEQQREARSAADQPGGILERAEIPMTLDYQASLARFEKVFLKWALQRFRGRINHTAREIRMSKATLIRRIRTYELRT